MLSALFVLWLIFNGKITAEIVLTGLAVSVLVFAFFCRFMGHSIKRELGIYRKAGYMIVYIFCLIAEVFKANFAVLRIILNKNIPIHQAMVKVRVDLKTNFARVLLANSITLTPGTITVALEGNEYTVHCLSREMIEGIENSRFVSLLHKMED